MTKMAAGISIAVLAIGLIFCGVKWTLTSQEWELTKAELSSTQAKLASTQAELSSTQVKLASTQADLEETQAMLSTIKGELSRTKAELERAKETAERQKFYFYYVSLAKQRYGVYDLEDYLQRWQWIEGAYVANRFDCSEMSAYLEWKLENEGYHTIIITGGTPWGEGRHAWLLVETSAGHYMPVEATAYSIVYWWDAYFDNYFLYDHEFETIGEALEYSPTEFDWWE